MTQSVGERNRNLLRRMLPPKVLQFKLVKHVIRKSKHQADQPPQGHVSISDPKARTNFEAGLWDKAKTYPESYRVQIIAMWVMAVSPNAETEKLPVEGVLVQKKPPPLERVFLK